MKNIISILILLALVAILVLKLIENKEIVQDRVFHFDKDQAISVKTQTLALSNTAGNYISTGNFMPNREAKINSEMQGKITSIRVNEGNKVNKGQLLIKLDDSLLKLQLKTLDVKTEGLKVDIDRFKILAKAEAIQGVQLEKVELALKTVNTQRATILEQIKKTNIYAPFSGIITMKMSEIGSFAAPGMPLLQLTDINKLKFTVNVPESDLNLFELNSFHRITADAFPNIELGGKTIMIGSKGNMGNSFPVQFELKNTSDLKLKSGMFGKLNLKGAKDNNHIIIPASSIVGSDIQAQVYLVTDSKAILHDVIITNRIGNKVIIKSGLKEGDKIVISGFINLYDGANINAN